MIGRIYKSGVLVATIEKAKITQEDCDSYDCDELRIEKGVTLTRISTPPDPDLAPAPALERGDYKRLLTALDAASTVAQVKGVLRSYLAKRAAG